MKGDLVVRGVTCDVTQFFKEVNLIYLSAAVGANVDVLVHSSSISRIASWERVTSAKLVKVAANNKKNHKPNVLFLKECTSKMELTVTI